MRDVIGFVYNLMQLLVTRLVDHFYFHTHKKEERQYYCDRKVVC